jgi:hypothetical protein
MIPGLETSRKRKGRGERILLVLEGHFKVKSMVSRSLVTRDCVWITLARPNTSLSPSAR